MTNGGPNMLSPGRNKEIQWKCVWDKKRQRERNVAITGVVEEAETESG